jgi:hypothetical protein
MDYGPDFAQNEEQEGGLVRLSRVTYQLADGQPDAMGWKTADIEGMEFGRVSDLLADAATGQIIFAAIDIDYSGKTALIPVEGMYLDMTRSLLIVPVRECEIRGCPSFTDDVVDLMPFVEYWLQHAGAAAQEPARD